MNMSKAVLLLFLLVSCSSSPENKAFLLLSELSNVHLGRDKIKMIYLDQKNSGLADMDQTRLAVFDMKNLDIESTESMHRRLLQLDYRKLPIKNLDINNLFAENINESDSGYYSMTLFHGAVY